VVRVLFIGGTGNISLSVTRLLAEQGHELTVLNRGLSGMEVPDGVRTIHADVRDAESVSAALRGEQFDVGVNWITFTPEHVEQDISLFAGMVSQYVFISSATVYRKPPPVPIVEDAPLGNPIWAYARDKVACEELLHRERGRSGFPFTIVRPSHTYGETRIPTALEGESYTVVERLRQGKPLIVFGDGTSFWTMTHNTDFARAFAGLLGNPDAIGESFHITSDEHLTWDQIVETIAAAAGFEPNIVHIPSDFIAALDPELGVTLLADKAHSLVFDNSKLKRVVPGFEAEVPFANGVARSLAWFNADPARQIVDVERDALLDRIAAAYHAAWPATL
jgi:nucleoside-diphosphate-sugar epimerase